MYPRISKFFFEILVCFSSHSRPRSFKLIQVDVVERGVSRWTLDQKASQHKQNHPNNGSVLFWSGSTDSDCLDFASLASAALRDFHRCVSNFRTSEGAVSVGDLQGIKSQLFISGSGGFLGSFPFSQGETLIFS